MTQSLFFFEPMKRRISSNSISLISPESPLSGILTPASTIQRRPSAEQFRQHVERRLAERIQKDAHGFFRRNFFVCALIALNEIVAALIAPLPLFPSDNPVFYCGFPTCGSYMSP
jgi:hypothetical protein